MTQYDKIASDYDRVNDERPDRAAIFVPSAKRYLGGVAGEDVLDLACGSGFFTRFIRLWGARIVVGVDVSEEMIKLARAQEKNRPLGVDYRVGDATKLEKLGDFDAIFGGFLLHYASSPADLAAICRNIALNLKEGGRFVAFNENPYYPLHAGRKYDVEAKAIGPIRDGVEIRRTHFRDGVAGISISHFHYEPATYEAALRAAGLSDIEWKPFVKGPEADRGFSPGYWDDFTGGKFSVAVLLARKR